jgi:phosphoribosylamine--glycine ligase
LNKNVLIVGSGGREHALGWKLSKSKSVQNVFFSPGNGGTSKNLEFKITDFEKIRSYALQNDCMIVVGPEEPLTKGIVNELSNSVKIFGPTKEAAQLESSKSFAKLFMKNNNIPTTDFSIFTDPENAIEYISNTGKQLVIKADGLAAGKGVIVCDSESEAIDAINRIMIKKEFGDSGDKVVIEERIYGNEVSFIGISDGKKIIPVATSQDHKRIYDDDKGPNTGGMGSFSPSPLVDDVLFNDIMKNIMEKTINSMQYHNNPFKGFLYAGVMIEKETSKPYVLEFNARMGDPECQPIMMRMKSGLYEYLDASIDGNLDILPDIEWSEEPAICVVMAEKGYPIKNEKGNVIYGLDSKFGDNVMVFHAGTILRDNKVLTNGGRILGVTALGENFNAARINAYSAVKMIHWGHNYQYYRNDIGKRFS